MLSNQATLLLDIATQEAKRRGYNPVVPVHIVAALIRQDRKKVIDNLGNPAFQDVATTLKSMSTSVLENLDKDLSTNSVLKGSRSEIEQWSVCKAMCHRGEKFRQSARPAASRVGRLSRPPTTRTAPLR